MLKEVESIAWQGSVPVEFVMKGDEVYYLFFAKPNIYISFNLFSVRVGVRITGLWLVLTVMA